ncbi:hypothetical protein FPV67DRAFT_1470116, partial [Lyophyllum atratum]
MLRISFLAVSTLLLSTLTLASPTPSTLLPRTCNPNFQGQAQTIFVRPPVTDTGVYEWTPASISPGAHISLQKNDVNSAFATAEFLVEFTGQPNGSYRIKLAADTNRYIALTAGGGGALAFDIASGASIPSQEFTITCTSCPSPDDRSDARGCTIAHPVSGKCITGSTDGTTADPRGMRYCGGLLVLGRDL